MIMKKSSQVGNFFLTTKNWIFNIEGKQLPVTFKIQLNIQKRHKQAVEAPFVVKSIFQKYKKSSLAGNFFSC